MNTEMLKNRATQKALHIAQIAFIVPIFLLCTGSILAASEADQEEFNSDMLVAVMELYGLTESEAVDRLARESVAANLLKQVESLSLDSYAGSWFDASTQRLKVAIANSDDAFALRHLDVEPIVVSKNLRELEGLRASALAILETGGLDQQPTISYVDTRANNFVITVKSLDKDSVERELDAAGYGNNFVVLGSDRVPLLSTGYVRGAIGTRNLTWAQTPGGVWPCSVGATVEDGYVTAGHCGRANHDFSDASGNSLSEMQGSTWFDSNPSTDSAYAQTVTGWTLKAEVNGYNDGIFAVEAEWAGMLVSPNGATVCRYGQTSGGPHCGTVDQFNVSVTFGTHTVTGLTQLSGSCSDDGDSGGSHVGGSGHIQGTNTGTRRFDEHDSCPTASEYVWFQPIKDTLDEYSVTMLTSHGASSPTVNTAKCPDWDNSGQGSYACVLSSADSQGEIQISWTTNTGNSSTSQWLFGTCSEFQTVLVTLNATNPYGTTVKNYSFTCPTGPIQ